MRHSRRISPYASVPGIFEETTAMAERTLPTTPQATVTLKRFADRAQLQAAVEERLHQVLVGTGVAHPAVMLSGGSTPIPAYLNLATRRLRPAPGLTVLFSDDRYVPSDSQQSNYHQSRPLFDSLGLAPAQVLRIRTELPLPEATADSERRLGEVLSGERRIVLGLLGLGCAACTACKPTCRPP